MALISSGIEKVRAFGMPGGIWSNGGSIGAPRVALVKWQSSWNDKFYQVYVNEQYSGSTLVNDQRQMLVQIPSSLEGPVRIEVFAVTVRDFNTDFSICLRIYKTR